MSLFFFSLKKKKFFCALHSLGQFGFSFSYLAIDFLYWEKILWVVSFLINLYKFFNNVIFSYCHQPKNLWFQLSLSGVFFLCNNTFVLGYVLIFYSYYHLYLLGIWDCFFLNHFVLTIIWSPLCRLMSCKKWWLCKFLMF